MLTIASRLAAGLLGLSLPLLLTPAALAEQYGGACATAAATAAHCEIVTQAKCEAACTTVSLEAQCVQAANDLCSIKCARESSVDTVECLEDCLVVESGECVMKLQASCKGHCDADANLVCRSGLAARGGCVEVLDGTQIATLANGSYAADSEVMVRGELTVDRSLSVAGALRVGADAAVQGDLTVHGDLEVQGDLTVTGNLAASGDVVVGGQLIVMGDAAAQGDLATNGHLTVGGDLDVKGQLAHGGDLTVGGKINGEEPPAREAGGCAVAETGAQGGTGGLLFALMLGLATAAAKRPRRSCPRAP